MKIKGVLSLVSIQSTPLTLVSLGIGYATVRGTVITEDIIPLLIVGALGHWTFYSMNDLYDYKWDIEEGRDKKPLVSESLSYTEGLYVCILLLVLALVASYIFPPLSLVFWMVAIAMGFIYNRYSKDRVEAGLYLTIWGASIIFTGSSYAGGINGTSVILALFLGLHMFWMTMMGNLKDIEQGENSIPELLDCKIVSKNGYSILWTSARFNLVAIPVVIIQIILLLLIPVGDGVHTSDVIYIYMAVIGGVSIWNMFSEVMYQPGFDRDSMKKDIVKFEIVSVTSIMIVSISFMSGASVSIIVVATVLWGFVWQAVLYGHPLRFP